MDILNYYWDLWKRHTPLLEYWTNLTSIEVRFKWNKVEQKVYEEIKPILDCNILLYY